MRLDPAAEAARVRLAALKTIDSTNKEAHARIGRGDRGPLWITAEAQTEGRGRGDRSWFSPPGNLYASLLMPEPAPVDRVPELAFVAAVALRDAVAAEAPTFASKLALKWPNDLLLAGEKCAGILVEGEQQPPLGVTVIIGIGVNCASHPRTAPDLSPHHAKGLRSLRDEPVLFPATALRAHGAEVTPQQLFTRLSATMCRRIAQWDHGRGFSAILGDWRAAAYGIGETIHVRTGHDERIGRFVGLDRSGRLMLEQPGGSVQWISAGDVFPLSRRPGPDTLVPKAE